MKECGLINCREPAIVAFPLCLRHYERLPAVLRAKLRTAWRGMVWFLTKSDGPLVLP